MACDPQHSTTPQSQCSSQPRSSSPWALQCRWGFISRASVCRWELPERNPPPKKRQRTTTGQSQIHKSTKSSSKVTGKNVHIEYAQIIFLLVFPKHYDLTMCMILHSSCVVQDNLNRLRMTQNSWEHMYKPKVNVTPFSTNEGLWFFKGPGNISLCILGDGCLFFYVTPSLLLSVLLLDSPFSGFSMSLL